LRRDDRHYRALSVRRFGALFDTPAGFELAANYNVALGGALLQARKPIRVVVSRPLLKWGMVPVWTRESCTEYSTLNARAETVAEKPAFRHRRCIDCR
jgi:putative SOS response-associated peptidase YedK